MRVQTEEETKMSVTILKTKAPALALSPITFSQQHFDLYSQQLRVYFNTLDTANGLTIQAVAEILALIAAQQIQIDANTTSINNLNVNNWLNLTTGIF
jgi:hypothetical protein